MQKHTIYPILLMFFSSGYAFGQNFKCLETGNAKIWQTKFDTYSKLANTLTWLIHKDKIKELLTYSFLSDIQKYFNNYAIHKTVVFPKFEEGNFTDKYVEAHFNK